MFTMQATFNRVVRHLRKQGQKAEHDKQCQYLTPDGLKCAAGCLIPKRNYKKAFEGTSICRMGGEAVTDLIKSKGHDLQLVRRLQMCHDDLQPCEWESEFQEIATAYGLKYTPPKS